MLAITESVSLDRAAASARLRVVVPAAKPQPPGNLPSDKRSLLSDPSCSMADNDRAGTSVTRTKPPTVIAQAAPNPSATTPPRPRRARASMTPGDEGSRDPDRDGLSIGERMAAV